jgi:hypothetical protein
MGLLDRHHEHVQEKAHAQWAIHVAAAQEMAQTAHAWMGEAITADDGIIARPGESAYLVLKGAALIEPRRLPGHWSGRSQGFSIPVYGGVRYRVGASKGTFQQGAEVPTPIDQGTVLISDQRVVFAGSKHTREWLYPKLIGFHHDEQAPWTALQVSNRQKVSGILYTEATETMVRFRLELALAQYNSTRSAFAASIDEQVAALMAAEPHLADGQIAIDAAVEVSPDPARANSTGSSEPSHLRSPQPPLPSRTTAAPPPLAPAGWYPNPQSPGQRYWDGTRWTDYTAP